MAKVKLKDIIIILPGITGSVLSKNDKVIWDASYKAIFNAITNPSALYSMKLVNDDPVIDDLGDGVRALRIASDFHLLPGLSKIDGYTALRRMIFRDFEVIEGSVDVAKPANYFEFPYDWRRDNRYSARKLKELVDEHLTRWRKHTGMTDAQVILIGHSMGGLISRYYLEVLEGWCNCKALITFGTPFRGSVNAVDSLVNGTRQLHLDLTDVMRTFTSVYQLLPIYPMLNTGNGFVRVNEVETLPNLPSSKVIEGLSFLREIEAKVDENRKNPEYLTKGYKIIPVVGTRQKTKQSALLADGKLKTSYESPDSVPAFLADGDGTVPRVSAIPIELSSEYRDTYIVEKHASLQNNYDLLNQISERLKIMQATVELSAIRGSEPQPVLADRPALGLEVADIYLSSEPVVAEATVVNWVGSVYDLAVRALPIESPGTASATVVNIKQSEMGLVGELGKLSPGAYRIELFAVGTSQLPPVHDVFLVMEDKE
jgi:pimeloyl-ACP methyl ester carboxylesterase